MGKKKEKAFFIHIFWKAFAFFASSILEWFVEIITHLCKLRFYHCALGQRVYRLSRHLYRSQFWRVYSCSLPVGSLLLRDCFFHFPWSMHAMNLRCGTPRHQMRAIGALHQLSLWGKLQRHLNPSSAPHTLPVSSHLLSSSIVKIRNSALLLHWKRRI